MKLLTTYTLKSLWHNKKRTIVTILGTILSSALICGVLLLGLSVQQVMIDHSIYMAGNWHARFYNVPYAKSKTISDHNAIETAMLSQPLGSATYNSQNPVRPYLYVLAYDADSFKTQPIELITGRLPQTAQELLISPIMIKDSGLELQLGASIQLAFGKRTIPNYAEMVKAWGGEEYVALHDQETFTASISRTYTIVGIMKPLADETSMPAAFPAFTYLDSSHLAATDSVDINILATNPRTINTSAPTIVEQAGLTLTVNPTGQATKDRIAYNERLLPWMGGSGHSTYVRSFIAILITLITLIVTGSALVIYNAFAISISQRKKQFGIFASVGATASQLRRIVLIEAGIIALIGIPLGMLGAIAGVGLLLKLTQGIVAQLISDAEQGMPLVVSGWVIVLTSVLAAATTLLSAWIPARRAARVSPIHAIRLSDEIQHNQPRSLHTSRLIRKFLGFEAELALKSLKRDRKRYRAALISLMISIILFIGFNAFMHYTSSIRKIAIQSMGFDLIINLDYRQSHAKDFAQQVSQVAEVQRVAYRRCTYEQYRTSRSGLTDQAYQALQEINPAKLSNDGQYQFVLQVCAVGPAEFNHYTTQIGIDPASYSDFTMPKGILINHYNHRQDGKLYDFDLFSLKPGDTLAIAAEISSTASLTWTVGAVTSEAPLSMMGMGPAMVVDLIVSDATFDGLHDQLLKVGPINPGAMYIKSSEPERVVDTLKQQYKTIIGSDFSYYSAAEFTQSEQLQSLIIRLFFYGFLSLITLIGVANIINTLDTNIKLRRREIAMLKSVGLTPAGLLRMLRFESLFYGLNALLYGLPLGIALSIFMYTQMSGVSSFGFSLPWGAISACIVGILTIVFVTMRISGAAILNDNIIDSLKAEHG